MLPVRLYVALLLLCPGLSAARAAIDLAEYQFQNWMTEDLLPQNAIDSLCQTRDGYIWVGTPSGLARFDGVAFTVFNVGKNPEMVDDTSRDLAEDAVDNSLWIASNNGLLQWKDHRFRRYTVGQGLPNNATRSVCASREGGVWVGTSEGYARYYRGSFTNYAAFHSPITNRTFVFEQSSGAVWLSTDEMLVRMEPSTGEWKVLAAGKQEPAAGRVYQFHEGKSGEMWFGNYSGLFRWQNEKLSRFTPSRSLGTQQPNPDLVSQILELSTGDLWAAVSANNALCLFRDQNFIPLAGPDGKPIQHVTALMEDNEGNIWIGTRYRGLMKLTRRQVTVYTIDDGSGDERVATVCESPTGAIWVGTHRSQFRTILNGEVTSHTLPETNFRASVQTIYPDRQGNLWFGLGGVTEDNVLWQWRNGGLVRSPVAVDSKYVSALYDDGLGSFWIGTQNGARRVRISDLSPQTVDPRLMHNRINAFFCDSHGQIWIGTDGNGLARGTNGHLTFTGTSNGLSSDFVYCFYEDSDKAMWIGTRNGVHRYKDNAFARVATEHGLPDDIVSNILEDDAKFLWLSSNRGICRVKLSELNAAADRRLPRLHAVSFGRSEGMRSGEAPTGTQPSAWKATDGRLWFATMTGVAMIDPKAVRDNTNEPPIVIEQVIAGDSIVFGPGAPHDAARRGPYEFRLPPGGGRVVEIHYTANSFVAPEKVTFCYWLEGHEPSWIDCGTRRVAYYTNLRPGDYVFHVNACNNAGRWNEQGTQIHFSVAPHIYQTIPFYVGCAGAIALTGFALHRRRLGVLTRIQRLEHANELEKERTRIAQDMHDDLGASLTQVAILSEVAKKALHSPQKVEQHVDRISTTARSMVDTITEIIWAIGPRNDRLDSLCSFLREHATNRLEDAELEHELNFPEEVEAKPVTAEFRRNVLLVLKESLNNVLKHSGATRVTITLRIAGDNGSESLQLLVYDNGRGFDLSQSTQFHNGLSNMRERILSLGGELTIDSRPGAGTDIRARVPLSGPRPRRVKVTTDTDRFRIFDSKKAQ